MTCPRRQGEKPQPRLIPSHFPPPLLAASSSFNNLQNRQRVQIASLVRAVRLQQLLIRALKMVRAVKWKKKEKFAKVAADHSYD